MDLSSNAVLYGDVMLPQEAFYTSDSYEMKLVSCIFETAKSIAELKLTETEIALYQSLVLLWPGKYINTEKDFTFWNRHTRIIKFLIWGLKIYLSSRTEWSAW